MDSDMLSELELESNGHDPRACTRERAVLGGTGKGAPRRQQRAARRTSPHGLVHEIVEVAPFCSYCSSRQKHPLATKKSPTERSATAFSRARFVVYRPPAIVAVLLLCGASE